ncbi:MAG TPA: hypothetical protein VJ650_13905 [Gemmatimonadaceae bacterium]|nr:hypothetical protein [Gemmatimonadaceae bacterium]
MNEILPFAFAFASLAVGASIVVPLARAWAKRLEKRADTQIPAEVASRLERMEQAIDSIAVEVERISEGQRYTTKLLADKARPYSGPTE